MSSQQPLLVARNIHKRYDDEEVLKGVDMTLDGGQVKVVLGSSGSGKSTLLRLIALLEPVDAGTIELDGEQIGQRTRRGRLVPARERDLAPHRSDIGMVFQRFNLFPHMTGLENVTIALRKVRKLTAADARERAEEMLERVGLASRAHAYPSELSGGQQQRVAIARALVMRPKVLLFDEPTSALDAELVNEVLDVMEGLASTGMTMLVVTHELGFARRVADYVCVMDGGVVVEEAPPAAFFSTPQHERSRRFLRALGALHGE
jgi:polar amino acid transport system ATP-binding protein